VQDSREIIMDIEDEGKKVSQENRKEKMQDEKVNVTEEEIAVELDNDIETENKQNLKEDFQSLLQEVNDYKDKLLRLGADFENYKKRMERDQAARMKYAGESVLKEMLHVVDNLERAMAPSVEGSNNEQYLNALHEGVQLTHKRLLTSLEKFEVASIESVGQPFDPNIQEAMTMEASDTIPANHVISEFERGYYYKDKLLRVAKVIVSSGPETNEEE